MASPVIAPLAFPGPASRPSPEYVFTMILLYFGSWDHALDNPDGRAVIHRFLPAGWQPPVLGSDDSD